MAEQLDQILNDLYLELSMAKTPADRRRIEREIADYEAIA